MTAGKDRHEFRPSPMGKLAGKCANQMERPDRLTVIPEHLRWRCRATRAYLIRALQHQDTERNVMQGSVIWFNDQKGYGFISREDGEKDIFVHHTAIKMEGYRTLKEGQKVSFEEEQGPNGLQAANVTVMN